MIEIERIKNRMDLLEDEINETDSAEAKLQWTEQAQLYMATCDEDTTKIERKCQKYYEDLIDEDWDTMWSKFYLAQSLQSCKDDDPRIVELYRSILDDKRSRINDLAAIVLHHLGLCYKNGQGTETDYKKAYECFLQGTESNDLAENFIEIGDMYFIGDYVKQDYQKAFDYYLDAYEKTIENPSYLDNRHQPRAIALYKIGECFSGDYGVKKDLDKAIDYYLDCKETADISYFYDVDLRIDEVLLEKRSYVR